MRISGRYKKWIKNWFDYNNGRTGCSNNGNDVSEVPFDYELSHVHGMGYAGNGDGLYLASHSGLKIYREGNCFETSDNFYDYMGFNTVDDGFYI